MKITTFSILKCTSDASLKYASHPTSKTVHLCLEKIRARQSNLLNLQILSRLCQVFGEVQAAKTYLQFSTERPVLLLVFQKWWRPNILFKTQIWFWSRWYPSKHHISRGDGVVGLHSNLLYKNKTTNWRKMCSLWLGKHRHRRTQSRSCASSRQEDTQRNP